MPHRSAVAPSAVALHDARPFFEKALHHGVQHGLIGAAKLDAIRVEAPKGMVQIARYFGSEYLRPELEKARARLVNLVSLSLEHSSGGDLRRAAEALRDHSLLSRSKGGSDLLKALIAMPQNSHFGMNERGGFTDKHIPLLGEWTLRSIAEYRAELMQRTAAAQVIDAAVWLADELGLDADDLEDAAPDAEAVIRTVLLTLATGGSRMPDWVGFEKTIAALRRQAGGGNPPAKGRKSPATRATGFTIPLPPQLPQAFVEVVEAVRQSILADLPRILDASVPVRKLFDQTPAFIGRYFWIEDGLSEVDHHDRSASEAWHQLTGGHSDDSSLLTLFLGVAAGAAPKTLLTEKGAAALVRKIRTSGLQPALARAFIRDHAPLANQDDYADLWEGFVEEAQATLCSDHDYALKDALALLRRECNVKPPAGGRG
jgi:hypothetical protein